MITSERQGARVVLALAPTTKAKTTLTLTNIVSGVSKNFSILSYFYSLYFISLLYFLFLYNIRPGLHLHGCPVCEGPGRRGPKSNA
jgi:hypothetical protein